MTYKEKMVRTAIRQAAGGNLNALIELINRTEGKVPDKLMANVAHTHQVVPWDDEDAPHVTYLPNGNKTDTPDSGRTLPPPDATDQTPPWIHRNNPDGPYADLHVVPQEPGEDAEETPG